MTDRLPPRAVFCYSSGIPSHHGIHLENTIAPIRSTLLVCSAWINRAANFVGGNNGLCLLTEQ